MVLKSIISEFFSISQLGCNSYNLADTVLDRKVNTDMGILPLFCKKGTKKSAAALLCSWHSILENGRAEWKKP